MDRKVKFNATIRFCAQLYKIFFLHLLSPQTANASEIIEFTETVSSQNPVIQNGDKMASLYTELISLAHTRVSYRCCSSNSCASAKVPHLKPKLAETHMKRLKFRLYYFLTVLFNFLAPFSCPNTVAEVRYVLFRFPQATPSPANPQSLSLDSVLLHFHGSFYKDLTFVAAACLAWFILTLYDVRTYDFDRNSYNVHTSTENVH